MKKFLAIIAALALVFALAACGGDSSDNNNNNNQQQPAAEASTPPADEPAQTDSEPAAAAPVSHTARDGAVTFEDGNIGFIAIDAYPGDSSKDVAVSVAPAFDGNALKVVNNGKGSPYVGIDVSSLLGPAISDLRSIEFSIATEHPDGNFYATSGRIIGYCGPDRNKVEKAWSVFLDTKNPNIGKFEMTKDSEYMVPGAQNFIVVTLDVDNGDGAMFYLDNITFLDASGNVIPADSSVGFDAPSGFGQLSGTDEIYELPVNGYTMEGLGPQWHSEGVDNRDDGMPADIFAISSALVIEMPEPSDNIMMVAFGAGNGWAWTEYPGLKQYWSDGKLTLNWSAIGLDNNSLPGDGNAFKVLVGDWDVPWEEQGATAAYIEYFKAEAPEQYDIPTDGHTQEGLGAQWITPGTDNHEFGMPVDIFTKSIGIVLEMPEPSEEFMMVAFGAGNGWAWSEYKGLAQYWSGGKMSILWSDLGIDAAALPGEEEQCKVLVGDWNVPWEEHGVTRVYLEYWN